MEKKRTDSRVFEPEIVSTIAVGGGPSGPSIEGPFCRAVHLCLRHIETEKREKKAKKEEK